MSHVDEGTLHAYLDGELPPAERTGLEQHLAQCATCRALLADERALLDRSTALLASARPVERPVPPFEQIRRTPRRPWYLRTSVAWAASIMLAVGLGYYLGAATPLLRSPARQMFDSVDEQLTARDSNAPAAAERGVVTRQPAPRTPTGRRTEVAQNETQKQELERDKAPADSTVAGVVALEPRMQLRNAVPTAEAPAQAPEAASVTRRDAVALAGAQSGVVSIRGRAVTTEWKIISRGAATTLLGTDPVGLPGLRTRRIRRSPEPDATVVVEQALDSSTTIQIFQRPVIESLYSERAAREAAPPPSAAAAAPAPPAPAPADRLARFVGRLRVEISGPLTTDSLNKLLEQVAPIP